MEIILVIHSLVNLY